MIDANGVYGHGRTLISLMVDCEEDEEEKSAVAAAAAGRQALVTGPAARAAAAAVAGAPTRKADASWSSSVVARSSASATTERPRVPLLCMWGGSAAAGLVPVCICVGYGKYYKGIEGFFRCVGGF